MSLTLSCPSLPAETPFPWEGTSRRFIDFLLISTRTNADIPLMACTGGVSWNCYRFSMVFKGTRGEVDPEATTCGGAARTWS
jgi:hypothetical protein